jgi:hypothetical protein
MGKAFTTGSLRLDIGRTHFLAMFQRSLVCNPPFYHHRDHIDLPMAVQPGFALGEESCVSEIHEITNPVPGTRFIAIAKNLRTHYQAMLAQARKATKRQVIAM